MAKRSDLSFFIGSDHSLVFTILNATGSLAEDITGWSTSFMLKRGLEDADGAALVTNTAGAVSGVYNSDVDVNTQILTVTLADTDTESLDPGNVNWELKRTTSGYESVLAYGKMNLVRGVHRA